MQGILYPNQPFVQWKPNTLSEGGLYHASMLAIVGVTAWGRTQEKLKAMGFEPVNAEEEPPPPPIIEKPKRKKRRKKRK